MATFWDLVWNDDPFLEIVKNIRDNRITQISENLSGKNLCLKSHHRRICCLVMSCQHVSYLFILFQIEYQNSRPGILDFWNFRPGIFYFWNFRPGIIYFWNVLPGILNSRPDFVQMFDGKSSNITILSRFSMGFTWISWVHHEKKHIFPTQNPYFRNREKKTILKLMPLCIS